MKEFKERIGTLENIHDIWAHGKRAIVVEEDDDCLDNDEITGKWLLFCKIQ